MEVSFTINGEQQIAEFPDSMGYEQVQSIMQQNFGPDVHWRPIIDMGRGVPTGKDMPGMMQSQLGQSPMLMPATQSMADRPYSLTMQPALPGQEIRRTLDMLNIIRRSHRQPQLSLPVSKLPPTQLPFKRRIRRQVRIPQQSKARPILPMAQTQMPPQGPPKQPGKGSIYDPRRYIKNGQKDGEALNLLRRNGQVALADDLDAQVDGILKREVTLAERNFERENMGQLQPETKAKIEQGILSAQDMMARINEIERLYNSQYQEGWKKLEAAGLIFKEIWLKTKLTPEQKKFLEGFTEYRAAAAETMSHAMKQMSRLSINPEELKQAELYLPNPGSGPLQGAFIGDGPTQLESKIRRFKEFTALAMARLHYVKKNGLTIEEISLPGMKGLMKKRLQANIVQARMDLSRQFSGVTDEQIRAEAIRRTNKEFGLVD